MLSDDIYRTQLAATVTALKRLAQPLSDVAHIEMVETGDFARLSLIPKSVGACPVEVMLRADQAFDIQIGTEFYEDCPIERFSSFEPLIAAITRGDVVQRRHVSVATGTERSVETIVSLPDGSSWRRGHLHTAAAAIPDEATLFDDRRFLPYRRG
jgi:hypothetical protein